MRRYFKLEHAKIMKEGLVVEIAGVGADHVKNEEEGELKGEGNNIGHE